MKTRVVTIHQAKTNLSRLLRQAAAGEQIIIARGSTPVAKLVSITEKKGKRQPGSLRGILQIGPEFFEPLSPDELSVWE